MGLLPFGKHGWLEYPLFLHVGPRRFFHWTSVPGKLGVPVASDNTSTSQTLVGNKTQVTSTKKIPCFVLPKKALRQTTKTLPRKAGPFSPRCISELRKTNALSFTQGIKKSQSLSIPHFVSKFLPWNTEELEISFGESEAFRVILHHLAKSLLQHFRECPIENRMRFPPHKVSSESDAKSKLNSQPEFLTSQARLEELLPAEANSTERCVVHELSLKSSICPVHCFLFWLSQRFDTTCNNVTWHDTSNMAYLDVWIASPFWSHMACWNGSSCPRHDAVG